MMLLTFFITIMFLNIRKIGKAKHKFKAKVVFFKVTNQSTEKGLCFKIKIERGSHQIEAISQQSRKGTAKFTNNQYVIPMTLFCDQQQKQIKYLQKQATIKAYQCDQNGKQLRRIGSKTLDLSEYASKGQLKLQIQLDPEKKVDHPVLILQIFLERQDDDSKSVDTYSSNNDKKNDPEIENQNRKAIKNRIEKQQLSQQLPNKKQKVERQKRYNTEDDEIQNNGSKGNYLKPPLDRRHANDRDRKLSQDRSQQFKKLRQQPRAPQQDQSNSRRQRKVSKDQQKQSQKNIPSQQKSQSREVFESKSKKQINTQFKQGQSPELQAFLLGRALKQKDAQISSLKRQNDILKKTIDKLIQQSSTAKQAEKRTGYEKQLQDLKKAMTSKDIEIDKLATTNKTLTARQQQYEKTIIKLRQEVLGSKEKICDMKYRQAYLMQELFETANKQGLEEASRFLSV